MSWHGGVVSSGLVALLAILAPRCVFKGHGSFASVYVPEQQGLFANTSLLEIVEAAKGRPGQKQKCSDARPRVVVTMSTFEGRLGNLKMALQSLAVQSCTPDAIYVFVSQNPFTKSVIKGQRAGGNGGDGVVGDDAFWEDIARVHSSIIVKQTSDDWGPATKLLAALQVESDPSTWLITVDDDTKYHVDTVLALVLAAMNLPWNSSPALWCEEAWADGYRSLKKRTMSRGEEGTVHGWCGGFAGVLFKRFMLGDHVFNFSQAPIGCRSHDDVWWGGHLLSAGNTPYLIDPGFFSVEWSPTSSSERQALSVHVLDGMAKTSGSDLRSQCASWFAALRGVHLDGLEDDGVFRHPEATSQGAQDLSILKQFFSSAKGMRPSGTFVEFGALDGIAHSNTNFFEAALGWSGALAEPSHYFNELKKNRPHSFALHGAICGKSGLRNFVDAEWPGVSGFEDVLDPGFLEDLKQGREWITNFTIHQIKCRTLQELLDLAKLRHVDYMSVDTEGSELEILAAFPFDQYQIDTIQVESKWKDCILIRDGWSRADVWKYWCYTQEGPQKLIQLMTSKGYSLEGTHVVSLGDGLIRTNMHHFWRPVHIAGEMTIDLFFRLG
mmetsp:Transcript_59893/g.140088  ORF Transcript_59893/g.140088 Transcript_59893/m.140088 type:complete len:609 (+) Transcript_59893:55-1881(+)